MNDFVIYPDEITVLCRTCGLSGSVHFDGMLMMRGDCTCGTWIDLEQLLAGLSERVEGETYDALGKPYPGRSWS